jgi:hypothetical protein
MDIPFTCLDLTEGVLAWSGTTMVHIAPALLS